MARACVAVGTFPLSPGLGRGVQPPHWSEDEGPWLQLLLCPS